MLLWEGTRAILVLASKKGIAITAAIVAGIVGASFLIWTIPQSSPGNTVFVPRTDSEIISDVYTRHYTLALEVETRYDQWKEGELASEDMLTQIIMDHVSAQRMQTALLAVDPAEEWQESYDFYNLALDSFLLYLELIETRVEEGERLDSDPDLDLLKLEWEGYVEDSVDAMPVDQ